MGIPRMAHIQILQAGHQEEVPGEFRQTLNRAMSMFLFADGSCSMMSGTYEDNGKSKPTGKAYHYYGKYEPSYHEDGKTAFVCSFTQRGMGLDIDSKAVRQVSRIEDCVAEVILRQTITAVHVLESTGLRDAPVFTRLFTNSLPVWGPNTQSTEKAPVSEAAPAPADEAASACQHKQFAPGAGGANTRALFARLRVKCRDAGPLNA